jgi:hypothetical protein
MSGDRMDNITCGEQRGRSHYELATQLYPRHRLPAAFTELALAL